MTSPVCDLPEKLFLVAHIVIPSTSLKSLQLSDFIQQNPSIKLVQGGEPQELSLKFVTPQSLFRFEFVVQKNIKFKKDVKDSSIYLFNDFIPTEELNQTIYPSNTAETSMPPTQTDLSASPDTMRMDTSPSYAQINTELSFSNLCSWIDWLNSRRTISQTDISKYPLRVAEHSSVMTFNSFADFLTESGELDHAPLFFNQIIFHGCSSLVRPRVWPYLLLLHDENTSAIEKTLLRDRYVEKYHRLAVQTRARRNTGGRTQMDRGGETATAVGRHFEELERREVRIARTVAPSHNTNSTASSRLVTQTREMLDALLVLNPLLEEIPELTQFCHVLLRAMGGDRALAFQGLVSLISPIQPFISKPSSIKVLLNLMLSCLTFTDPILSKHLLSLSGEVGMGDQQDTPEAMWVMLPPLLSLFVSEFGEEDVLGVWEALLGFGWMEQHLGFGDWATDSTQQETGTNSSDMLKLNGETLSVPYTHKHPFRRGNADYSLSAVSMRELFTLKGSSTHTNNQSDVGKIVRRSDRLGDGATEAHGTAFIPVSYFSSCLKLQDAPLSSPHQYSFLFSPSLHSSVDAVWETGRGRAQKNTLSENGWGACRGKGLLMSPLAPSMSLLPFLLLAWLSDWKDDILAKTTSLSDFVDLMNQKRKEKRDSIVNRVRPVFQDPRETYAPPELNTDSSPVQPPKNPEARCDEVVRLVEKATEIYLIAFDRVIEMRKNRTTGWQNETDIFSELELLFVSGWGLSQRGEVLWEVVGDKGWKDFAQNDGAPRSRDVRWKGGKVEDNERKTKREEEKKRETELADWTQVIADPGKQQTMRSVVVDTHKSVQPTPSSGWGAVGRLAGKVGKSVVSRMTGADLYEEQRERERQFQMRAEEKARERREEERRRHELRQAEEQIMAMSMRQHDDDDSSVIMDLNESESEQDTPTQTESTSAPTSTESAYAPTSTESTYNPALTESVVFAPPPPRQPLTYTRLETSNRPRQVVEIGQGYGSYVSSSVSSPDASPTQTHVRRDVRE
ncbi:hypothetical protein BLNAU_12946 [Blattamonas nauphoetae]|uniref:Rab-GAP TBC domain-containing protein n=1 Tax=Blattamonas nauphoetae TaxID=2049346 RepID=A0ABQ9XLM1_9EUKA|nr:hypothetical protein BLNAU_12946 [Blattamonas nauphoetae]